MKPSDYAEQVRYLPESNSTLPGFFRFDVCPYMREPADCLGVESPIREVAVMKGVQICATTSLLENGVLYWATHIRTAPMMLATATLELVGKRMDGYLLPMFQQSKLGHLIQSSDEDSSQKKGKSKTHIEFAGGARLTLIGANSSASMRSIPSRILFRDEIDDWPDSAGTDGDPLDLTKARTKTFESNRKILDLSTPTIKGKSKIERQFLRGDQRHYFVCCLGCGYAQTLGAHHRDYDIGLYGWRYTNPDTGEVTGFVWDTDSNGKLVPGSVRWLCHKCGHAHTNDDKTRLLSPEYGAEWRPTATPEHPSIRSYFIPALYSPVGMQTWDSCVQDFLEAYDVEKNETKSVEKFKVFTNNILGESFEERGDKLTVKAVDYHRRTYSFGQVPNKWAKKHLESPVLFTVCTVDVHKHNLAVARWGWCKGVRPVLLDYERIEGNCDDIQDQSWEKLRDIIGSGYTADDGAKYAIELALIDAGYRDDVVYQFCDMMGPGVYPIRGRGRAQAGGSKHFRETKTAAGTTEFHIGVDLYKDRWSAALRKQWSGQGTQPGTFLNLPDNITEKQLKELTVEKRVAVKNLRTGEIARFEWHRPNGVDNELWDLLIYANAAHDILAAAFLREELEIEEVDDDSREEFWRICEEHQLFFHH